MGFNLASIKGKVYSALGAIFLVVIISNAVILYSLKEAKHDAETINIIGRQRMLTQAMAKSVLGYSASKEKMTTSRKNVSALNAYITKMRRNYTKSIIKVAKKTGLGISMDPAGEDHPAVPFPATFTRFVNADFGDGKNDLSVDILAENPINPDKGLKTDTDKKASDFLHENPEDMYMDSMEDGGKLYIHLYTSDRATIKICSQDSS